MLYLYHTLAHQQIYNWFWSSSHQASGDFFWNLYQIMSTHYEAVEMLRIVSSMSSENDAGVRKEVLIGKHISCAFAPPPHMLALWSIATGSEGSREPQESSDPEIQRAAKRLKSVQRL